MFGVDLMASGGAGDACSQPYSGQESFSQPLESASNKLTYSASAVGYDNAYPNPNPPPAQVGCQYSPAFATTSVNATASLGSLSASANANMMNTAVVGPNSSVTAGWYDLFTANGGNYLLTFTLNDSETASQSCATNQGNAQAAVNYYFSVTNAASQPIAGASWNDTDCSPNAGPMGITGDLVSSKSNTVEIELSVSAGTMFGVSAQVTAQAGTGAYVALPDTVAANATALLTIEGLNGATYNSASGTIYNPEPASWLLASCGIGALWLGLRRRRSRAGPSLS